MEFTSDNADVRLALQIVANAIETEKIWLGEALFSGLRAGLGKIEDPAIEDAVLRIRATINSLRLDLDEDAEAEFIRALGDVYGGDQTDITCNECGAVLTVPAKHAATA